MKEEGAEGGRGSAHEVVGSFGALKKAVRERRRNDP
jgi:hypothetical protein